MPYRLAPILYSFALVASASVSFAHAAAPATASWPGGGTGGCVGGAGCSGECH